MNQHAWRSDQGGLMVFEPIATERSLTRESWSQRSVGLELGMPADTRKQEDGDRDSQAAALERKNPQYQSWSTTPSTSAGYDQDSAVPSDLTLEPSPSASSWEDIFQEQVQYYAAKAPSSASTTPESKAGSTSVDNYDTDGTDFLPSANTPCPRRTQKKMGRGTGITSHFFQGKSRPDAAPVARRLWPAKSAVRLASTRNPPQKTANDKLRDIECSRPRKWSFAERQLLCIINRWFKPGDARSIPTVFRAMTGSESSNNAIRSQWDGHILWYGPKAIPEFAQVFGCPFSDPTDHYRHSIEAVECKARQLGVELTIRKSEPNFIAGQAASSKAERVRRQYKALCRRASQSTSPTNSSLIQSGGDPHMSRLGSFPMTSTQQLEDPEVLVDVEKTAVTPIEENVRPGFRHESSLAYRVWDDSSRTAFSPTRGFVANGHQLWNGTFLPPPDSSLEQGNNFLMFLANQHFCMTGGDGSGFCSVSTSLVQVIQKAARMINPQIALIALDHPCVQDSKKKFDASSVLAWLKKNGQAQWARHYRGRTEILFWASIPVESVIQRFSLSELGTLAHASDSCAELLGLEEFRPGRTVPQVVARLRERNIGLRPDAMGRLARTFGLDGAEVHLDHIRDFVTSLVDGWTPQCDQLEDAHTMSSHAMTFATSLRSRTRVHHLQEIMGAFLDGCRQGNENIQFYARRKRNVYRRRTD